MCFSDLCSADWIKTIQTISLKELIFQRRNKPLTGRFLGVSSQLHPITEITMSKALQGYLFLRK